MPGAFFGLEIARRGLQAHRAAMDTAGHNIANASTPGYSRQEAVINTSDPYSNPALGSKLSPGQLGSGVEVSAIRRLKNEYLDVQLRDSLTSLNYWQTQEDFFVLMEAVFPEPNASGLSDMLTQFFQYWHDLNNNPQDPGVKAAVVEAGDELATMMQEAYKQLENILTGILEANENNQVTGGQIKEQVDTVNQILSGIQELTASIKKIYAHGNQPNDLLDERDQLLDQLACYGPVNNICLTQEGKATGEISLDFFKVNINLTQTTLSLRYDDLSEQLKLTIGQEEIALSAENTSESGSLSALEQVRRKVNGYLQGLEALSAAVKDSVNQILNPAGDALDFFTGALKDGDFRVNTSIKVDPALIDGVKALYVARLSALGMDGEEKQLGDGVTINSPDLSGATFSEYTHGLLTDIGASSKGASNMTASRRAVSEQVESLRQSVSGVNLDEELTSLIQFQYGYQASARVLTAIDEMLDYLINRTG